MPRGSAPGERRGRRQQGVPNKATVERRLRAARGLRNALADGLMPAGILLARLSDQLLPNGLKATDEQFQAAYAPPPYFHPSLAATAVVDDITVSAADDERRNAVRVSLLPELHDLAKPTALLDATIAE